MTTQIINRWLTCLQPNPQATVRLFCFPHAGGGALSFRHWVKHLPSTVEICPIALPGRELRLNEPALTRLEPLVEAIAEALIPSLDKPFIFFGHSMGGLLSFELARKLHMQQDLSPSHLFVSGRHAPQLPDPDPPIHNLPEPDFLEALRRLNGTPLVVLEDAELMQMVLPTVRADFAVVETYTYRPAPPLNCPITVFGGWQDPKTSPDLLDAWREQTTAGFSRRMLPGDHFFLHTAQAGLLELLAHNL